MTDSIKMDRELRDNISHNNGVLLALLPAFFGLLGVLAIFMMSGSAIILLALYALKKFPAYTTPLLVKVSACFLIYFAATMGPRKCRVARPIPQTTVWN